MKCKSFRSLIFATALIGFTSIAFAESEEEIEVEPDTAQVTPIATLAPTFGSILQAESRAFSVRTLYPERAFLWNGEEAVVLGPTFYTGPSQTRRLLLGALPSLTMELQSAWAEGDSIGPNGLALLGGSESGDMLYREIQAPHDLGDNRTPSFEGNTVITVTRELQLRGGLRQVDAGSYRTFSRRVAALGERDWEDVALFGENLPEASLWHVGADLNRRGSRLTAAYMRGWRWVVSPLTGISYPYEVQATHLVGDYGDGDGVYLDLESWDPISTKPEYGTGGKTSEVGLRFGGKGEGWAWRMAWGYARRTVESAQDSLNPLSPFEESRFPWTFIARRNFQPEWLTGLSWLSDLNLSTRQGLLSSELKSKITWAMNSHKPEIGLEGYWSNPLSALEPSIEFPGGDTLGVTRMIPGKYARGIASSLGYGFIKPLWQVEAITRSGSEWARPEFIGQVAQNGDAWRIGQYQASNHVLNSWSGEIRGETQALPRTRLEMRSGYRLASGYGSHELEYEPSPWWAKCAATVSLPTDLSLEATTAFVGDKYVRGWPVPNQNMNLPATFSRFRIPAHIEGNLGIRQRFLRDRFSALLFLLHAASDENLEHPAGNPVRFRILLGLTGKL